VWIEVDRLLFVALLRVGDTGIVYMEARTLTLAQRDCQNSNRCAQPQRDESSTRTKSTPQREELLICLGIVAEIDLEEAEHRMLCGLWVNVKENKSGVLFGGVQVGENEMCEAARWADRRRGK
jgi:hypothetical protein